MMKGYFSAESRARRKRATQRAGVTKVLNDRQWHSLADFKSVKGVATAISARIREWKDETGRRCVECKRFDDGIYRYRKVR